MVTYEQPYGKPAAPEQIVITVTLGDEMRSPMDVAGAVGRALLDFARHDRALYQKPFVQQASFPQGTIRNRRGAAVGEWKVTS